MLGACSTAQPGTPRADGGAAPPATGPPATAVPFDPARPGPHAVGYVEVSVTDPARGRTLPVSVWYPADAPGTARARYQIVGDFAVERPDVFTDAPAAAGAHPVVVFSHGSGGTRFQSWFLTEALASHGFVVAAPDHPGNTFNDPQSVEAIARAAQERPKDVPIVIDDLLARSADPTSVLAGHLDPSRIGMMGHSYGGYTALTAAGGSAFGDPPDARVRAIAPLAPAASIVPEANLRAITVPILLMGGTLDNVTPPASEVLRTYDLVSSAVRYRVVIERANHNTYSIECGAGELLDDPSMPEELRAMAKAYIGRSCGPDVIPFADAAPLISRYVVAFFASTLGGDTRARALLSPTPRADFAGSG